MFYRFNYLYKVKFVLGCQMTRLLFVHILVLDPKACELVFPSEDTIQVKIAVNVNSYILMDGIFY